MKARGELSKEERGRLVSMPGAFGDMWINQEEKALLDVVLTTKPSYRELLTQKPQKWIFIGIIVIAVAVLVIVLAWEIVYVPDWPDWTGFDGKTAWDFVKDFSGLIALLTLIYVYFRDRRQRLDAQKVVLENMQEDSLQNYLEAMTKLLKEVKTSEEAKSIVHAMTHVVLRRADGKRKGSILRFLYNAKLISGKNPTLDYLWGADLSGADLSETYFRGINLSKSDLSGATLCGSDLSGANLCETKLRGADLRETKLGGVDLKGADLRGAKLRGAKYNVTSYTDDEGITHGPTDWPDDFREILLKAGGNI